MNLVNRAAEFASDNHRNQRDDNGLPHFVHCRTVAKLITRVMDIHEIIAAAYLHDIIEDTDVTFEELKEEFGETVANLVFEVTKVDKHNFPNLKSRDAILIKFADRLHNLSRMDVWDEKRQEYYLNKSKFWITGEEK